MLSRRHLLATGLAGLGLSTTRAWAHDASQDDVALPEAFQPRTVELPVGLPPGEIHVHPNDFALYWTMLDGLAIRYSCGVGRLGLYEPGIFYVGDKKEWPTWTPTPDMIAREPERYEPYADGMPGGPDNPLGARALYLYTPERGDTLLRIHGTNDPSTIGTAISNGCARLVNDHIAELYEMVPQDTPVYLHPQDAVPLA